MRVFEIKMDEDERGDDLSRLARVLFGRTDSETDDAIQAVLNAIIGRREPKNTFRVIQRMFDEPDFYNALSPVTSRTLVELPEDAFYLGSQGAKDDDRHVHLVVKDPTEKDEWALHVACPRSQSVHTVMRFRGDRELVIRKVNTFLDIGYGMLDAEAAITMIKKKWREERAAAGKE